MFQRLLEGTGRSLQDLSENMFKDTVELGEVLFCLSTLHLEKKENWTIAQVEQAIKGHLRTHEYEKITLQQSFQEELNLTINIDINTELGILCCDTKVLKSKNMPQILGKILLLKHLVYQEKLIVIIVGKKRYKTSSNIELFKTILEEQEAAFLFLPTN